MNGTNPARSWNWLALLFFILASFLFVMLIAYYDEGTWRNYEGFWHFAFTAGYKDLGAIIFFGGISTAIGFGTFAILENRLNFYRRLLAGFISIPLALALIIIILVLALGIFQ